MKTFKILTEIWIEATNEEIAKHVIMNAPKDFNIIIKEVTDITELIEMIRVMMKEGLTTL